MISKMIILNVWTWWLPARPVVPLVVQAARIRGASHAYCFCKDPLHIQCTSNPTALIWYPVPPIWSLVTPEEETA